MHTNHAHCVVNDRQIAKAEKVHFQKAQLFERRHGKLRYNHVVIHGKRHISGNGIARNDYARSMRGRIARHAFNTARCVNQIPYLRIRLKQRTQLRGFFQRLINCHFQLVRNQLRYLIHRTVGHAHYTPDVADGRSCGKCAERHNLRHMIAAVFLIDIVDHFAAPFNAEIHVKVRHADAFRIQKTLEKQIILHRVNPGDTDAICRKTSCAGTSPRPDRNALAFGISDKVMHDQEIIHIPHPADHVQLIIQPFDIALRRRSAVTGKEAEIALFAEPFKVIAPVRDVKMRQLRMTEFKRHIAAIGNYARVSDSLRTIGEQREHFLLALDIHFFGLEVQTGLFTQPMIGLYANQNLLYTRIRLPDIMRVVRRSQRYARFFRKPDQMWVDGQLLTDAVVLYFQIIVVFAENISIL